MTNSIDKSKRSIAVDEKVMARWDVDAPDDFFEEDMRLKIRRLGSHLIRPSQKYPRNEDRTRQKITLISFPTQLRKTGRKQNIGNIENFHRKRLHKMASLVTRARVILVVRPFNTSLIYSTKSFGGVECGSATGVMALLPL
jgi:hypothetical protein